MTWSGGLNIEVVNNVAGVTADGLAKCVGITAGPGANQAQFEFSGIPASKIMLNPTGGAQVRDTITGAVNCADTINLGEG